MHVVIIGNGITGSTVARHVRKYSDHEITMISDETDHFFSRTALMYVYMGHMRAQDLKPYEDGFWQKNRINLKRGKVEQIDTNTKQLQFAGGETMSYDKLVLATGSKYNTFNWPGQDLKGVSGLYSWQDLEYLEAQTEKIEHAVIAGGGLIGVELAEMLKSRGKSVTMLVRESSYWNGTLPARESEMVNRHLKEHGVDLRLNTELEEILDDGQGQVKSVRTSAGELIECQYVGLTVGVHPNIEFIKNTDIATEKGILVNEYLETNIPDVYAAGDCAQFQQAFPGRKNIEQVWYTGKIQAEALALTICKERTAYEPGIWFNSAKFFDVEYQVYGEVPAGNSDSYSSIYWEHTDGRKSIRIVFEPETGKVKGFNLMGIRYRHAVCDHWIKNDIHIEEVLTNLGAANFDPEFFEEYETSLVQLYNAQFGKSLQLKRKRGLKGLLELLGVKTGGVGA